MFHCNCQTKAGKEQNWRALGLARPGKVGRAFSPWYQVVRVPDWQLQRLQCCRPDPGVHYSSCAPNSQSRNSCVLKAWPWSFVGLWSMTKGCFRFTVAPTTLDPEKKRILLWRFHLSFPECDTRFSWTQGTYGMTIALFSLTYTMMVSRWPS